MTEDTIAAISTPLGEGGIAIVRVSGPRALEIADAIFVSSRGKPSAFPTHTIHLGSIGRNGDRLDQVMLAVMRAPRTYTTEDIIEINSHGGPLIARSILSLCLKHGARLAEPGEFTKRAFLNGRLDLTQAEAVMDLISAKTDRAQSAATRALEGHLSRQIEQARQQLLTIIAHIEAHIDFPDEGIAPDTCEKLLADTVRVTEFLQSLLATAHDGKILRHGFPVTIVGRPNAGKSSLMNVLLGHERMIVTPVAGTTRDTVEEIANIGGLPVRFTDTAGIRSTRGTVERLGVERSLQSLDVCELVLHILDVSRSFSRKDFELARHYAGKPAIHVLNKIDLPRKLKLPDSFPAQQIIDVSCKTSDGLDNLKEVIRNTASVNALDSHGFDVAVNERQAAVLSCAIKSLTGGINEMRRQTAPELTAQQLRLALDAIGEIVGKTATEDILSRIFSTFCIGK